MTRSDILLDTNKTIKIMEEKDISSDIIDHVSKMADILDDLWILMLAFERDDSFNKMGQHMRNIFYREVNDRK